MSPRILVLCLALLAGRSEAGDTDRPNVLLMIADDQGWADLSCMGIVEDVKTPRLDALAGEGVRFERAYAGSPICNVSRSALITGCYPQRFGSFWYGGKGIHDTRFVTLSELFDAAGYDTAYVGNSTTAPTSSISQASAASPSSTASTPCSGSRAAASTTWCTRRSARVGSWP